MANDVRSAGPVLLAYDGSDLSRQAIRSAGLFLKGREAVVLHVHEPVVPIPPTPMGAAAIAAGPAVEQAALAAEAAGERAREIARQGAREVESMGLSATSETVVASGGSRTADAIVEAAERHGAPLIVVGSHGRSAIAAALLGSVSTAVLHRSTIPVLVVPQRPSAD